jgi:hypothetical protein
MAEEETNRERAKRIADEGLAKYNWADDRQEHLKHWRSWGSFWSWGTPTGLGLFFVLAAFAIWILFHL